MTEICNSARECGVKDAAEKSAMIVVYRKQKHATNQRQNKWKGNASGFTETFAYSFRGCNSVGRCNKCKDAGWRMTRLGK